MSVGQQPKLDDILEHYGIKGMRWGVRRSQAELDRAAGRRVAKGKPVTKTKRVKRVKKEASADAKRSKQALKKAKKGGVDALSNQELKDLNNRLNLEQNYNRLTATDNNKTLTRKGAAYAGSFIADVATTQAKNLANNYVAKKLGLRK